MSASREELSKRVKAARQWLEKAEASLGQDAGIRGELNLLLAQAEMQKLRETHKGLLTLTERKYWWELLAFMTALWFLVMGVGNSALAPAENMKPQAVPVSAVNVTPSETLPLHKDRLEKDLEKETSTIHEIPAPVAPKPIASETAPVQMSNAELHALVSDAGKVLRGRE